VLSPTLSVLDSATVYAFDANGQAWGTGSRNGSFLLLLPASTYDFRAFSAAGADGYPHGEVLAVPVQADTSIDIILTGEPVTGLVSGPDAEPLEGALVIANSSDDYVVGRTGPDGMFTIYLPHGTYTIFCAPGGMDAYILARVMPPQTIAGPEVINFDLSGVEWSGTVRSSASLQPVGGVRVRATLFADSFNRHAQAVTDGAGAFRLVLEPNREYGLGFSGGNMEGHGYQGIKATADSTFDILLDPLPTP
jgi:hypothetical protein